MAKVADRYLKVDPWLVVEEGFHPDRSRVSESLFSLGNEFMGVRAYFEEGYGGNSLIGSYFNGVFELEDVQHPQLFKGIVTRSHFMVNALDWLHTRILVGGERLDLATSRFSDFERCLDLRKGILRRSFVWTTAAGQAVKVGFERFLSMVDANLAGQRITLEAGDSDVTASVTLGLDFTPIHEMAGRCLWETRRTGQQDGVFAILGQTEMSRQRIFSSFRIEGGGSVEEVNRDGFVGAACNVVLRPGSPVALDKMVVNLVEKDSTVSDDDVWARGMAKASELSDRSYDGAVAAHIAYWADVWEHADVTVDGDPENQQGLRFSIFHLHQTYHGVDPSLNIGAKGLTGEEYAGWTWWDTETYCLPFYMFTNPKAARNLLSYRYTTLPEACERATELDCEGARYPMATIDGTEACGTWQHGDLEIHVPAAVAYGIWHYDRLFADKDFLYGQGIEMLVQISRYFASRGQWGQRTGEFGFWGVMGADEFHMMVHNNCYTNVMAKKCFEFTLQVLREMADSAPEALQAVRAKVALRDDEPSDWANKAEKMRIPQDAETGVYEQHDGFFDLPHVDTDAIPPEQFPLYKNWAYVRIFRYDMIKQPDVLLLHFFFSEEYSDANKRANFEYYEPRCSHESSLSPAIHSILAAELGLQKRAYDYMKHASRLDLDNYNRNTHEGIHNTCMAAAWMNVVYGFGGMRSDGETLSFKPSIPDAWNGYGFKIQYRGSTLDVHVGRETAVFRVLKGAPVPLRIYGEGYTVGVEETVVRLGVSE